MVVMSPPQRVGVGVAGFESGALFVGAGSFPAKKFRIWS
jgi:hypothetical protein